MFKRSVAIVVSAAVLALLAVPSAQAEGPDLSSYGAGSSATALVVSLLGEELAVSATTAAVGSVPEAAANGAALLLAGSPVPGDAPSISKGEPAENSVCPVQVDLDQITMGALSGLELEIACLDTSAVVTDGAPAAESGSGEVTLIIRGPGGALLEPILTPLLEGVTSVTDPIIEALAPLLGAIQDVTQIDVGQVVDDLITAVGDDLFVLAEIVVAPTLSRARANAGDGVVAEAGSNGVTINLLPGIETALAALTNLVAIPDPSAGPLLQVRLGSANASVVRDPKTGDAAPDASAAQLLSITADDQLGILTEITGQLTDAINGLAIDQLSCDGGALADIVCVDLGAVSELTAEELAVRYPDFAQAEGVIGREASAASVAVLPILSDALGIDGPGVLGLSLASADAAAFAVPTVPAPAPAPARPDQDRSLPTTGAASSLPVALALFAAATVGLAIIRRTRTV